MIRNFLKIAFRNIQRHTGYTFINVGGLALGLCCALLIFSLVTYHLSFDNFHHNSDRIYRFVTEQHRDQITHVYSVPSPFGKAFRNDYTYGESVARICTMDDGLITIEEHGEVRKFKEEFAFVETEFFDIFNYPMKEGQIEVALREPNTAVLTESMAIKFFGKENPINKTFRLDNKTDFRVAGVLKDLPSNTERKTQIYFSYSSLKGYNEWLASDDAWGGITSSMQAFVRLRPGVSIEEIEARLPDYVKKYRPTSKNVHHYKLQPLSEIHFDARYGGVMEKRNLWILSLIGFFLVITACVNFINLATAQAVSRSREVGIRKVLGSVRKQLFWQFIMETAVITTMAVLIALVMASLVLPYVNELFQSNIPLDLFADWRMQLFIPALAILVTFLSGSYPGLVLSGYQPALALKGKIAQRSDGFNLRRSLIVGQFAISQLLVIGLLVIIFQMRYAKESDMGFDKDAIVMVSAGSWDERAKTLLHEFQQIPGVEKISRCYSAPASTSSWRTSLRINNSTEEEAFHISYRGGDDNFLSTFQLNLLAGRNLLPSDTAREFIVNEAFLRKLNISAPEEVLGMTISVNGGNWKGPVVGVVGDFHNGSFHQDIDPIFITTRDEDYEYYAVKLNKSSIKSTLTSLEQAWTKMYPDQIYSSFFLDAHIAEFYQTEETMVQLIQAFSLIAIIIGSLGLYGLVSFMAARKTKEIGIRKVLGGHVHQILWIFGKEFLVLVLVAFVIAAPLGWWLMNNWLTEFKYHIELHPGIFLLAISFTAVIALLTVSYQSLKAAVANPVDSLRSE